MVQVRKFGRLRLPSNETWTFFLVGCEADVDKSGLLEVGK